eukprot:212780_1
MNMEAHVDEAEMQTPVDRYHHKVSEMHTMGLIAALIFGFSISLWIEFDEAIFIDKEVLAFVFTFCAITTILSSALATISAISIIISFRRLMFKYGKHTNADSLRSFKRSTHYTRHWVRYFLYLCYIGLFISLAVYSHAKWTAVTGMGGAIYIVSYVLFILGFIAMFIIYIKVKSAYHEALTLKAKSSE